MHEVDVLQYKKIPLLLKLRKHLTLAQRKLEILKN
jgi:hypothetical protein